MFGNSSTSSNDVDGATLVPFLPAHGKDLAVEVEMDTFEAVQSLQSSTGFSERAAETVADLTRWLLRVRLGEYRRSLVSQTQCDNDLALIGEAFGKVQSSLSAVAARDSIEIRSAQDRVGGEIGALLDGAKEAVSQSRTDLVLAVNAFKAEAGEESQRVGLQAHQQEGRLAVGMGAFRTDSENVKLRAIWTYSIVLCLACISFAAQAKAPRRKKAGAADIDNSSSGDNNKELK